MGNHLDEISKIARMRLILKIKIVRELKPNNSRAFREGTEQVLKYAQQLKKQFGGTWKTVVDTYDVLPNGTIKYNYGIPK